MNRKPNIILFLLDDLGYGDISCLNKNSKVDTKNIDALAGDGITFTDSHSCSAVCTPSRYGILTGRYAWRSELKAGVLPGPAPALIEEGRATIGTMLRSAGYNTAAVGKWHLGMDWATKGGWKAPKTYAELDPEDPMEGIDYDKPIMNGPNTRGFDYFFGMPGSLDQPPLVYIENDRVLTKPDHVAGIKGWQPHKPGEYTADYICYGPVAADYDVQRAVPDMHNKVLDLVDKYADDDKPFFIYSPTPAVHGPLVPTDEFAGKSKIGPYGDMILMVDDFIGKLETKLKNLGIADNTIIIFTSDNGCAPIVDIPMLVREYGHNSSHIFRGCKFDIWEGGHRVPLIVKWPEMIKPGASSDKCVCLTDLFSTIAEVVGYDYGDAAGEDSVSMLPLWKGGGIETREATVHHSGKGMYSIRKGSWKLELCAGSGGVSYPAEGKDDLSKLAPVQLYDLSNDIGEQENLYGKRPDIVKELKDLLASYVIAGRSTPGSQQRNFSKPGVWPGLHWMNL
ncbi:MAG: arylsulfatase [Defluviitaleaceae bacterium]|nr:arylsulfatase [Defluviitaleaceae bacterium]